MQKRDRRVKRDHRDYGYVRAAVEKTDTGPVSENLSKDRRMYNINEHKRAWAEDEKELGRLQKPCFFKTPHKGDNKSLENYSESNEREDSNKKNVKLMHLSSEDHLQQLAVRKSDRKRIFLAASNPMKAVPSADMKYFEKAQSIKLFAKGTTGLYGMGGKKEGAASIEMDDPHKWSMKKLKPFAESEKSSMLSGMMSYAGHDNEASEIKELNSKLERIRAEKEQVNKFMNQGLDIARNKAAGDTLAGIERVLEIRISRLDEIIRKKDYAKRRMQQRLTFVEGLLDEMGTDQQELLSSAVGTEESAGENGAGNEGNDANKGIDTNKEKDGGNA